MWPFRSRNKNSSEPMFSQPGEQQNQPLSRALTKNLATLQKIFANCSDVTYRELIIGQVMIPAQLLFVNGLTDETTINENILKSLKEIRNPNLQAANSNSLDEIKKGFLEVGNVTEVFNFDEVKDAIFTGSTVFLLGGSDKALKIGTKGVKAWQVAEPITEGVVRGPREGFTETLRVNTALLRRKIKSPFNLKDAKDLLVRAPWWTMGERPRLPGANNKGQQKFFLKPGPPD